MTTPCHPAEILSLENFLLVARNAGGASEHMCGAENESDRFYPVDVTRQSHALVRQTTTRRDETKLLYIRRVNVRCCCHAHTAQERTARRFFTVVRFGNDPFAPNAVSLLHAR